MDRYAVYLSLLQVSLEVERCTVDFFLHSIGSCLCLEFGYPLHSGGQAACLLAMQWCAVMYLCGLRSLSFFRWPALAGGAESQAPSALARPRVLLDFDPGGLDLCALRETLWLQSFGKNDAEAVLSRAKVARKTTKHDS